MAIFNSYVKLPEGIDSDQSPKYHPNFEETRHRKRPIACVTQISAKPASGCAMRQLGSLQPDAIGRHPTATATTALGHFCSIWYMICMGMGMYIYIQLYIYYGIIMYNMLWSLKKLGVSETISKIFGMKLWQFGKGFFAAVVETA